MDGYEVLTPADSIREAIYHLGKVVEALSDGVVALAQYELTVATKNTRDALSELTAGAE